LVYFIRGWARLKPPQSISSKPVTKVTVLVAARNEEDKISKTIDDILAQDYPKHLTEIIMVDDHSTDRTAEIIRSYADRGVKLLQLQEDKPLNSYKKKAIAKAISMSEGDLMVATDADCRMGNKWLSTIVSYFETSDKVMISSPVTYFEERTLFEYMQTLEFSYLIGLGAAFIGNGKASTCNGANLAYRKDVFYEVGGFTGIDQLASGDDELLLQKVAARYPGRIGFLKSWEAIVYTHAKHTLPEFMQQRRRWASKSTHYKNKKVVAVIVGIWLFNVLFLANGLLSFYSFNFFKLFALQFGLKFLFETAFLFPITSFLRRPGLIALLVLIIPVHVIYFVYIGLRGNTGKYVWKGRMVR
jgi:cellulose synthase/poly-beta-1,6-N-acetylglucosamine synthase-like glycosyltransferase